MKPGGGSRATPGPDSGDILRSSRHRLRHPNRRKGALSVTWVGLRSPGCAGRSGCGNEVRLSSARRLRRPAITGTPQGSDNYSDDQDRSDPRIAAILPPDGAPNNARHCLAIPLDTSINLPLRTSAHASMEQPSCQISNRVNFKKSPHKTELCEHRGGSTTREMSTLVNSANKRLHSVLRLLQIILTKSR